MQCLRIAWKCEFWEFFGNFLFILYVYRLLRFIAKIIHCHHALLAGWTFGKVLALWWTELKGLRVVDRIFYRQARVLSSLIHRRLLSARPMATAISTAQSCHFGFTILAKRTNFRQLRSAFSKLATPISANQFLDAVCALCESQYATAFRIIGSEDFIISAASADDACFFFLSKFNFALFCSLNQK